MDKVARFVAGGSAASLLAWRSLLRVEDGHVAIMPGPSGSSTERVFRSGWHLKWPVGQTPLIVDIRPRPTERVVTMARSRDSQPVRIGASFVCRPEPDAVPALVNKHGAAIVPDGAATVPVESLVVPIAQQALRAAVWNFSARDLISKREEVSARVHEEVAELAEAEHLIVERAAVEQLNFSVEFTARLEHNHRVHQQLEQKEAELAAESNVARAGQLRQEVEALQQQFLEINREMDRAAEAAEREHRRTV